MIEELIKYFKETPREQILKDWEESKELDKIGISALEYISKIDFLDTKIDDCDLSIRTKNICRMNDFKVIRDLIAYSTKDLMMLHFGKRTISEIQEFLFSKGYSFGSQHFLQRFVLLAGGGINVFLPTPAQKMIEVQIAEFGTSAPLAAILMLAVRAVKIIPNFKK